VSETPKIDFAIRGPVAQIVLNRPEKLNALDPEMLSGLEHAIDKAEQSGEVRVILLKAAGEKAFSVGADILAWTALSPLSMWADWVRRGHRIFNRIRSARQPTIGVIQGYAYGGGLELALSCDLRIAAETARFATPEVKLGTVPGWGGTRGLAELIGPGRAKQMIYTGEPIDAAQAERWGLVSEVVSFSALEQRTDALAARIAECAPIAVQTAKQLIAPSSTETLESLAAAVNAFTADAKEGLAAFREKRSPNFKGL
jgi:enoyl-CoA hydratase